MRMYVSKSKIQPLNMNTYRNLHFHSLNYQKRAFKELVEPLLRALPRMERIELTYQIFPKTKRLFDIVNIASVVDKYFSDALTECGVIPDDNYQHIADVHISFGGFSDREHVLVTITEIEPKKEEDDMKILLDTQDIQNALDSFVLNELGLTGATGVQLNALDDGTFEAEVLMGEVTETKAAPKKTTRKSPAKKAAPKAKEADNVETDGAGSTDSDTAGSTPDPQPEAAAAKTESGTKAEGGNSKNPSEESQGSSSSTDLFDEDEPSTDSRSAPEAEAKADTAQAKAPVASGGSIFDEDD